MLFLLLARALKQKRFRQLLFKCIKFAYQITYSIKRGPQSFTNCSTAQFHQPPFVKKLHHKSLHNINVMIKLLVNIMGLIGILVNDSPYHVPISAKRYIVAREVTDTLATSISDQVVAS